jgi:hypothetical protein
MRTSGTVKRVWRLGRLGGLGVLGVALAGGCGPGVSTSPRPTGANSAAEPTVRVVAADADRVPTDVGRAAANLGWGVRNPREVVMPDDRVMQIETAEVAPGRVELRALVMPFGDPLRETQFLQELARVLRGPRAREYGGRFELPP